MHRKLVAAFATLALGICVPSAAAAPQGHFFHPRVPIAGAISGSGWASSNWSGYAKTGSGISRVTGQWTVPAVSPTRRQSFAGTWIGIDGFNNSSLIQAGTEQDYYNGSAHYDAWWELIPAPETPIASISVSPGDVMQASITKGSGSSWTISITDTTTHQSFTTVQSYSGPQTSAEWILEAPTVGNKTATLAQYSPMTFDNGTINGRNPGLTASDGGVLIQGKTQVSTPSNPDRDTNGFNMQYGSTVPPAPAS